MSISPNQRKIQKLVALWCEYVGMGYHKHRDTIWTIKIEYSHRGYPTYRALHSGYIAEEYDSGPLDSLAQAESALLGFLREAFESQRQYVREVLESPADWDQWDIEQATFFVERVQGELV